MTGIYLISMVISSYHIIVTNHPCPSFSKRRGVGGWKVLHFVASVQD